jgi:phosphate starvation-inducible PhoH-like protein
VKSIGTDRLTLDFENYKLLPLLFGQHDSNLARIEQKLHVALACFGNTIEIKGATIDIENAGVVLKALYEKLEAAGSHETLEPSVVDAAIKWVKKTASTTGKPDLTAFKDISSTLTTWKRKIAPRSPNQHVYVKSLLQAELAVGVGPAGTGKTYLAVAIAVSMLKKREIDRIILSRPAVEAGERLGFLPGDLKDKVDPYLRPLYDALHDMMDGEQVERMIETGEIEIAPLAFMRGRTLNNSFIILDESQNATVEQMKMFLTRFGFGSKVVVTGDITQIDLPKNTPSGLVHCLRVLKSVEDIGLVEFETKDVVRHGLVQKIVEAYAKFID